MPAHVEATLARKKTNAKSRVAGKVKGTILGQVAILLVEKNVQQ